MPKKRRSDGKGNVVPHTVKERHTWKCDAKGCNAKGKAYTKQDAKNALTLHKAFAH
jgi:hypothetical protein